MALSIPVNTFYGKKVAVKRKSEESASFPVPYKLSSLLSGPTLIWKVFKKQADALDLCRKSGFGLMTFAFETDKTRLFLVAHPDVFWHYDSQREPSQRNSYEIIPENSVCKLYFDLEYDRTINPGRNDDILIVSFIKLFSHSIHRVFDVRCDKSDVLILDSSTPRKFSAHLIFNIPNVCFIDNYNAGNFIKYICNEISTSVKNQSFTKDLINSPVDIEIIKNFVVLDSKGNSKLICDECVYSKNRHFRVFKSTKKGKNSPLILYKGNTLKVNDENEIFLLSLISRVEGSDRTKVLQYEGTCNPSLHSFSQRPHHQQASKTEASSNSPYSQVDNFVKTLIAPGHIYRSVYFSTSNVIVYDIIGNRYCGNIKREHKSNNVKYIVDLGRCEYYQKCHDYECSSFRSERVALPYNLAFSLTDNSDLFNVSTDSQGQFSVSEEQTNDIFNAIEDISTFSQDFLKTVPTLKSQQIENRNSFEKFPSFGLPDDKFTELGDLLNC